MPGGGYQPSPAALAAVMREENRYVNRCAQKVGHVLISVLYVSIWSTAAVCLSCLFTVCSPRAGVAADQASSL